MTTKDIVYEYCKSLGYTEIFESTYPKMSKQTFRVDNDPLSNVIEICHSDNTVLIHWFNADGWLLRTVTDHIVTV
jgi:hypothetical protein